MNYPPQSDGKRQQVLRTVKKGVGEGNLKALLLGLQWHLWGIVGLIISCAEQGFRSQEFERSPNCFLRVIHGYLGESVLLSVLWFLFRNTGVELHPPVAKAALRNIYLLLGRSWQPGGRMDERIVESRAYFGVLSALKCHPVNSLSSELLSQPFQKEVSIITPLFRLGNWNVWRGSNISKSSQQVSGEPGGKHRFLEGQSSWFGGKPLCLKLRNNLSPWNLWSTMLCFCLSLWFLAGCASGQEILMALIPSGEWFLFGQIMFCTIGGLIIPESSSHFRY